ncbi:hypothetical protein ABPG72_012393 [Tetrahymena utriculariae]
MGCFHKNDLKRQTDSNLDKKETSQSTHEKNMNSTKQIDNTKNTNNAFEKDKKGTQNEQNIKNKTETNINGQKTSQIETAIELDESSKKYYQTIHKISQNSINEKIISLLKKNKIDQNDIEKTKQEAQTQYKELKEDYIKEYQLKEDMQKLEEKCKVYDNQQTFFEIRIFMIIFDKDYLKNLVMYIENLNNEYLQFLKENNIQKNILEYIEKETQKLGVKDLRNCDSRLRENFFKQFQKKLTDENKKFQYKTQEKMISDKYLIHQILKARLSDADDINLRQLIQIVNKEAEGQSEFITFVSQLLQNQALTNLSQSQLILQLENNYNFLQKQIISEVGLPSKQESDKSQVKNNNQQQQSNINHSSSTLIQQFGFTQLNNQDQITYPSSSSQVAMKMTNTQYELQPQNNLQYKKQAEEFTSSQIGFQQQRNYNIGQDKKQAEEFSSSQIGFQQQGNYNIGSKSKTNFSKYQNQQTNNLEDLDTDEQDVNKLPINSQYFGEKIVSKLISNVNPQLNTAMNTIQSNNKQRDEQNQNQTACYFIQQYNLDLPLDTLKRINITQTKLENSTQQLLNGKQILKDLGTVLEQN